MKTIINLALRDAMIVEVEESDRFQGVVNLEGNLFTIFSRPSEEATKVNYW
jgi:hypothetical protein